MAFLRLEGERHLPTCLVGTCERERVISCGLCAHGSSRCLSRAANLSGRHGGLCESESGSLVKTWARSVDVSVKTLARKLWHELCDQPKEKQTSTWTRVKNYRVYIDLFEVFGTLDQ